MIDTCHEHRADRMRPRAKQHLGLVHELLRSGNGMPLDGRRVQQFTVNDAVWRIVHHLGVLQYGINLILERLISRVRTTGDADE